MIDVRVIRRLGLFKETLLFETLAKFWYVGVGLIV